MATCFLKHNFLFRICFILAAVVTPTLGQGLPSIQVEQNNYDVNHGESITLECTVESNPEHTSVNWKQLINGIYRSIIFSEKYGGSTVASPSLTINSVEKKLAGSYVCTAANANGLGVSTQINLFVKGDVPTVTGQTSASAYIGWTKILTCRVSSDPIHSSVQWFKNYQIITIDNDTYMGGTVASPSLRINRVGYHHEGTYACTATNSVGTGRSSDIMLYVYNRFRITSTQSSVNVNVGAPVTLKCIIYGGFTRPSHVFWTNSLSNDLLIIDGNTSTSKYNGSTYSNPSLTIKAVDFFDVATYFCNANTDKDTITSSPIVLDVIGDEPTVQVPKSSYIVNYMSPVTLECTVTSVINQTSVQWFRLNNNQYEDIILSSNKYDGSTVSLPSLTLRHASYADMGKYICTATNTNGTGLSTPTHLNVNADPCTIKNCANGGTCVLGDDYTASCICQREWNGTNCEISPCDSIKSCKNNGTCHVDVESGLAACSCSAGYSGETCEDIMLLESNILITEFKREGNLTEGSVVTFTCSADLLGNVGIIPVTWKLNGTVIDPISTSRWKPVFIPMDLDFPRKRQYQLIINPILTIDSGTLTCHLSNRSVLAEKTINIYVIGKPVVSISPLTTTVFKGENLNIECTVVNSYSVATSIVWYKDGHIINSSVSEAKTTDTLSVMDIQKTVNYECSAINVVGGGQRVGSSITVMEAYKSYMFCPFNKDNFNTKWGGTVTGVVVVLPCTGNYTGTKSRKCNDDDTWEDPDYSYCVRKDLQDLIDKSESLSEEIQDVDEILGTLTNLTSEDNEDLTSGDLNGASVILDNIAVNAVERPESLTVDQLEIFASACNNLLQNKNKPSWTQLKNLNWSGITKVVNAVTVYTKAYTNIYNDDFNRTVVKENLVVNVGKIKSKDIHIPDRSVTLPTWLSESTTAIKINKDNFNGQELIGYSSTYYRNISELFHEYLLSDGHVVSVNGSYDVNSVVVDFSIEPTPQRLNTPLFVELQHLTPRKSSAVCVFWDFNVPNTPNGAWSTIGSRLVNSYENSTICEYDHTTNFAVLMSPGRTPSSHVTALSIISTVGCGISILFLTITLIIYAVLWRHVTSDSWNSDIPRDRAIILINLCVALILSYILFLAGVTQTDNKNTCAAIAVLLHYIFLVDFSLMLAEGIEIAFNLKQVFSPTSRIHWLLPLCWFVPALIVSLSAGITKVKGYGNSKFCWLSLESGLFWAFAGPALLIILINFIILVMILRISLQTYSMKIRKKKEQAKAEIANICVLLPLFGLTWVFGIFSVDEDSVVFQYLFTIFNSLQGFFLFLFHCFLDKKVKKAIKHLQRKGRSSHLETSKLTSSSSDVIHSVTVISDNFSKNEDKKLKESNRSLRQRTDSQITDKTLQTEDDHGDDKNIATADVKFQFTDPEPEVGKLTTETDPGQRVGKLTAEADPEPRVGKLTAETDPEPRVGKLTAETDPEPRVGKLTAETDPEPRVSKLTAETDPEPRVGKLTTETDPEPRVIKLTAETDPEPTVNKFTAETDPEPRVGKLTTETDTKTKRHASKKVKKRTPSQLKKQSERRPRRSNANNEHPGRRKRQHESSMSYYDNLVYPSMDGVPIEYRGYQPYERPYMPVPLPYGYSHYGGYWDAYGHHQPE